MAKISTRPFSLPAAQAAYVDANVDDRAYASASEVVGAGLRALQERDAAFERWLKEEAVPTNDAMQARPGRGIPAQEVFAEVRVRFLAARRVVERRTVVLPSVLLVSGSS